MAFQRSQTIYAGSALLLIGDIFTPNTGVAITTTTTGSALITDTQIDVTAPTTIAPNVAAEGAEANPCVVDVIGNTRTNEIMLCYSTNTTTGNSYINVVRGWSKWWSAKNPNDTTYAVAMNSGDELEYLGTGSFPDWSTDFVFTNEAVTITLTQDSFMSRNNQRGNVNGFTGAPATIELACTLPNNTIAQYVNQAGKIRISNSAATASYMQDMGSVAAGVQLVKKFIVVVPNEQYYSNETVTATMGGVSRTYRNLSRAFVIPVACLNTSETIEFAEGTQKQIPTTFTSLSDDVHCVQAYNSLFTTVNKLFKSI